MYKRNEHVFTNSFQVSGVAWPKAACVIKLIMQSVNLIASYYILKPAVCIRNENIWIVYFILDERNGYEDENSVQDLIVYQLSLYNLCSYQITSVWFNATNQERTLT